MTDIETIAECCKQLTTGWSERVEYQVRMGEDLEIRVQSISHGALLGQLHVMSWTKGSSSSDGGSNPNKAGSRPPLNMAPVALIGDISEEARDLHNELYAKLKGCHASVGVKRSVNDVLRAILAMCASLAHVHPMEVRGVALVFRDWVKRARRLLGYDAPIMMLADTVCGSCGGALVVAQDASTDVRCIGKPYDDPRLAEEPCGTVYRREQWIFLL